jgi:hypothetical protein
MARRRGKGLPVSIRGGAMVQNTNAGMQAMPKHGRKNRGLTGRSRKVRKVGSGRM